MGDISYRLINAKKRPSYINKNFPDLNNKNYIIMKNQLILIFAAVLLAGSSCAAAYTCPTYSKNDCVKSQNTITRNW